MFFLLDKEMQKIRKLPTYMTCCTNMTLNRSSLYFSTFLITCMNQLVHAYILHLKITKVVLSLLTPNKNEDLASIASVG